MTRSKGRKGLFTIVFAPGIVMMALVVLLTAFSVLSEKYKEQEEYPIGVRQFDIMSTAQEGNAYMQYAQYAAELAYPEAQSALADNGGYYLDSECGTYRGRQLWYANGTWCEPDAGSEFLKTFASKAEARISSYPAQTQLDNYEVTLAQGMLVGTALESTRFDIKMVSAQQPQAAALSVSVSAPKNMDQIYQQYGSFAKRYGQQAGVSPALILGLITQESSGDAEAVSYAQAVGLGQFIPSTARGRLFAGVFDPSRVQSACCQQFDAKKRCVVKSCTAANDDRMVPEKAVQGIAIYLKSLMGAYASYTNKEWFALGAYNGGGVGVGKALRQASAAGNSNPSWHDLLPYLQNLKTPANFKENAEYPPKVMGYKSLYEQKYPDTRVGP